MDLSPTPTKTTPDTDTETPPRPQPTTSLSFTNATLKRHHHLHAPPQMVVSYRECVKNHAASIGGQALDGCGEFIPYPTAVPSDPTSLKCAACGCHRNFHRQDQTEGPTTPKHFLHGFHINGTTQFQILQPPPPSLPRQYRSSSPSPSSSPGPTPSPHSPPLVYHLPPNSYFACPPPMLLSLSTGFSSGASDDHHQHTHQSFDPTVVKSSETNPNLRKRFRTKFSQEQKEKMCLFAEKVGWTMQRSEESLVEEFCKEVGVRRGVLQVWMHNNKHTPGKRDRATGSHNHKPR